MKKFIFIILFFIVHYSFFINHCLSQWQPDIRLTNDPFASTTSLNYAWCIAASGDTVHVNWYDTRNGATQVYYKRSTDKGITWGPDTRLSTSSTYAERGGIAVNGPMVHIVWQDFRNGNIEIYYIRSIDGGNTWGSEIRLTYAAGNSWGPTISVSGFLVHVLWTDTRDGNTEVYYKRSTDGGITWGADTRLTINPAESWYPVCTQAGSIVHVVWTDTRSGTSQVYYKRSTDNGLNWGIDTRVTYTTFNAYNPTIAVNGSIVHIAWHDNRDGNDEIYYNRSTNAGLSWGADTRLTYASDISSSPSLACSESNLHLTWEDLRDGNYEIYYKLSTNGGLNWTTDTRLTNSIGMSWYASVCVSVQCVHVVWFDERDGNREIYYKRNPLGNLVGSLPIAPVLIFPLNGSTVNTLTPSLEWGSVNGASSYRVQVSPYSDFSSLTLDTQNIAATNTIIPSGLLRTDSLYYWRANASNEWGTGAWSVIWNFRTYSTPQQKIQKLIITIDSLKTAGILNAGNANLLKVKLNNALVKINNDQFNVAINMLNAFINEVEALIKSHRLTEAQRHLLIDPAIATIEQLKGGGDNTNPVVEIPKEYKIYQNYPNPFNPSTSIKYDLPKNGFVKLVVFDAIGREVEILVNENQTAGTYEITFEASQYPSGVYFYRLTTEGFIETKKMLMIK